MKKLDELKVKQVVTIVIGILGLFLMCDENLMVLIKPLIGLCLFVGAYYFFPKEEAPQKEKEKVTTFQQNVCESDI